MKFIKEHSYDITKLLINQLAMTVFGLVLSLAFNANDTLLLLVSIFSVCFHAVIVYTVLWDLGSKDGVKGRARGLVPDYLCGLKIGLLANAINALLAVLMLIGAIISLSSGQPVALYNIAHTTASLLEAMFLGIVKAVSTGIGGRTYITETVLYFLAIVPTTAAATLGYVMGYLDKRIFSRFQSTPKQ